MADLGAGLPAREAVHRLLAARGRGPEQQVPGEFDTSAAGMLEVLRRFRLHGRWTEVSREDLIHAELPTLATGREGTFYLLDARKGRQLHVEGQGCVEWVDLGQEFLFHLGPILDLHEELPSRGIWTSLLGLLLAAKRSVAWILFLAIIAQGLGLLAALGTRVLVDWAFPAGATSMFRLIVAAAIAQAAFRAGLDWLQGCFAIALENAVAYKMERGFLHRLFNLPFRFFNGRSLGELLQGVHGLAAAREFLIAYSLPALVNVLGAVAYLAVLFHQVPTLAWLALGMALLPALILAAAAMPIVKLEQLAVNTAIRQWGLLAEMLHGLPTLKAAGAERRILARWTGLFWQERSFELRAKRIGLGSRSGSLLAGQLQAQILNVCGALAVLDGSISLGAMLAFTMMAGALQDSMAKLGDLFNHFLALRPQLKVTEEILAAQEEVPEPGAGTANLPAGVEVEGVSYRYSPDHPWILQGLNLRVDPGQVWRIPGGSGSGKTTLLRLLAGLLEPCAGRIRLFGLPPRAARKHLCYLPQKVRLFQGTVLDNLRLFSGGADWKRIQEVSAGTGLTFMVERLPMKWDTWVAQGGSNFSGGERQLVALTGVLAANRNLLLLDEATANMDLARQAELAVHPLFRGKTIIYASHCGLFQSDSPSPEDPP